MLIWIDAAATSAMTLTQAMLGSHPLTMAICVATRSRPTKQLVWSGQGTVQGAGSGLVPDQRRGLSGDTNGDGAANLGFAAVTALWAADVIA